MNNMEKLCVGFAANALIGHISCMVSEGIWHNSEMLENVLARILEYTTPGNCPEGLYNRAEYWGKRIIQGVMDLTGYKCTWYVVSVDTNRGDVFLEAEGEPLSLVVSTKGEAKIGSNLPLPCYHCPWEQFKDTLNCSLGTVCPKLAEYSASKFLTGQMKVALHRISVR